jgi:hypothetical protein
LELTLVCGYKALVKFSLATADFSSLLQAVVLSSEFREVTWSFGITDRDGDDILTEDEFSSLQTEGDGEKDGETLTQGEKERRKEFRDVVDKNHDGKADRKELLVRELKKLQRSLLSKCYALHRYELCTSCGPHSLHISSGVTMLHMFDLLTDIA